MPAGGNVGGCSSSRGAKRQINATALPSTMAPAFLKEARNTLSSLQMQLKSLQNYSGSLMTSEEVRARLGKINADIAVTKARIAKSSGVNVAAGLSFKVK